MPSAIVQKLWNYCNILRDDGLSYGDYVEQLTYLLSQGAEQDANPPFGKKSSVTIVNEAGETSKESVIINREDFLGLDLHCLA